jgi:DNA modification methylase
VNTITSSRVHIADSRSLSGIEDNSIHLMITSPPYWHIKDYGKKDQLGYGQSLHDYLKDLYRVWKEVYRVLAPGRRACINIGDQFTRSSVYGRYKVVPIHAEIILQMERTGFDFMGSIIWNKRTTMKTTGGANIMGSYPYPPNGIIEIDYEHILIFKKPGKSPKFNKELKESSKLSKEEWKDYHLSHWNFGGARQVGHEAMFPEELPKRLVKMFSLKGEIVLDPFLGSGTTALASNRLGRNCIGYEINPDFIPLITKRLSELNGSELEIMQGEKIEMEDGLDYIPSVKDIDPVLDHEEETEELYKIKDFSEEGYLVLGDASKIGFLGVEITDMEGAREYLKRYVIGKKVILKENNGQLAYFYLTNRIFVNKELVKGGWARVDRSIEHSSRGILMRAENSSHQS